MSCEQKLGLEIMRISTLIRRCADNTLPLQQVNNITGSNGWILQFLAEHEGENVFQRDLQNSFSVTRSTISKVVKLMESKGLIRRESVFSDARLKKLKFLYRIPRLGKKQRLFTVMMSISQALRLAIEVFPLMKIIIYSVPMGKNFTILMT